ncbi:MAG: hypothetical protein M9930_19180 [Anaerolineae bacterium]|nr:hypothetical protein [Anaerolineae bacterium]
MTSKMRLGDRANQRDAAVQRVAFRFYDTALLVETDSAEFLHIFGLMYRHFQVDELTEADLHFQILTGSDNKYGQPVLVLDGDVWPLNLPALVRDGVVFEMVLATIMRHIQSHLLIHAGVVARNGEALLFSADSFHGKTTLVLKLLQYGFSFLSDDIAPLSRHDRRVYPFPRSLRIRPGTLSLAGYPVITGEQGIIWRNKLLLDVEELRPDCIGRPAPIGHIIILHDDTGHSRLRQDEETTTYALTVVIDRADPQFMLALQATPGLVTLAVAEREGHPQLDMTVTHKADAVAHLYHWSHTCRVFIIELATDLPEQPDFGREPRLETVSKSGTITHLLKQFKGSHQSKLFSDAYGGSSTRLYVDLAGMVKNAQCHRLRVGRLDDMVALIDAIAR